MDAKSIKNATRALLLTGAAVYAVSAEPGVAQACAACTAAIGGWCTWEDGTFGGGSYCTWTWSDIDQAYICGVPPGQCTT